MKMKRRMSLEYLKKFEKVMYHSMRLNGITEAESRPYHEIVGRIGELDPKYSNDCWRKFERLKRRNEQRRE